MEAHFGAAAHQPRCDVRALVAQGEQVRRRLRRPTHLHLLLRGRERLVGLQAHQGKLVAVVSGKKGKISKILQYLIA